MNLDIRGDLVFLFLKSKTSLDHQYFSRRWFGETGTSTEEPLFVKFSDVFTVGGLVCF